MAITLFIDQKPGYFQSGIDASIPAYVEQVWYNAAWLTVKQVSLSVATIGQTSATRGQPIHFYGSYSLASLNAGINPIIAGVAGFTIIPFHFRINVVGTPGGAGSFILEDTNGTPVVIVTAAYAALGSGVILSSDAVISNVTIGAGFNASLTAGAGVQIPAMASLTTLTSINVDFDYYMV